MISEEQKKNLKKPKRENKRDLGETANFNGKTVQRLESHKWHAKRFHMIIQENVGVQKKNWYLPYAPTEKKLKQCLKICSGKIAGTVVWDVSNHLVVKNTGGPDYHPEIGSIHLLKIEDFFILHNQCSGEEHFDIKDEMAEPETNYDKNLSRFILCGNGRKAVLNQEVMQKFGTHYRKEFENENYTMVLLDKSQSVNFLTHVVLSSGMLVKFYRCVYRRLTIRPGVGHL